jgi:hypothetical protein
VSVDIVRFDGQIELEALRLYGLPEDAPGILHGCPSLPAGTRTLALETSWDLPSLGPGATANVDVTVTGGIPCESGKCGRMRRICAGVSRKGTDMRAPPPRSESRPPASLQAN